MGHVAFGAYRISIKSKEHKEALLRALEKGCSLIDTSSNYTNGESEELIGEVLSENPKFNPIIVTKAGYVQGRNLEDLRLLNEQGKSIDVVDMGEHLKHSIHPDFLRTQIMRSIERLKRPILDVFLLHNPEYYFKTDGATKEDYYKRIELAFKFLESAVEEGLIKSYGISSNNFVLPPSHPESTELERVLAIARAIKKENHFTTIEFPFNLIEIGALEKLGEYGDLSLLELAKLNNLTTLINRPLNAFTNEQFVRLATYDFLTDKFNTDLAQKELDHALSLMQKKWKKAQQEDEEVAGEDLLDVPLVKQFIELWKTLPSPDAVDQVYYGHFFPFLARLWGNGGLSAKESQPFYKLMENSLQYARLNMSKRAREFQDQAAKVGLVPIKSDRPFAVDVIETYLDYGFDYVLVGMRKVEYVDQLSSLF